MKQTLAMVLLVICCAANAGAQQRPLVTEDPETVGAGVVLIEGGVDLLNDMVFPAAGLEGNLLRLPTLGASFGLSSIAELQIDGGIYNRLAVEARDPAPLSDRLDFTGDETSDVQDLVIGTKLRLVSEAPGRPALGLRMATKLPVAGTDTGLGTGTTDFYLAGLFGKTVQSIRLVGNMGIAVLGDPTRGDGHNQVLTYGASLARAIYQGTEVVGEVNGRFDPGDEPPPGTENRSNLRGGIRFTRGTVRIDGALIVGLTSRDPSIGLTGGVTWVFRGFSVP
jgi:hypothetical protein